MGNNAETDADAMFTGENYRCNEIWKRVGYTDKCTEA